MFIFEKLQNFFTSLFSAPSVPFDPPTAEDSISFAEPSLLFEQNALDQSIPDEISFQDPVINAADMDMSNPYTHPGIDLVVDESYHGIDHGLGIANPESTHCDDFIADSGTDNSFFDDSSMHSLDNDLNNF